MKDIGSISISQWFTKKRLTTIFIIIASLVVFNFFSGFLTYSFMIVRCGHYPVTASRFAAGYQYYRPGHGFYGPNMFAEYYCSAEEAEKARFSSDDR